MDSIFDHPLESLNEKIKVPMHVKYIISPERKDVDLYFLAREFIYKIEKLTKKLFTSALTRTMHPMFIFFAVSGRFFAGRAFRRSASERFIAHFVSQRLA
ncbi:MAG: hypothetical protein IKQ23_00725 [Treponema sp.]|nr:hypothetical protein [Treponema sp.]